MSAGSGDITESSQYINQTAFEAGDQVVNAAGAYGTVVQANFEGNSTMVFVRWNIGPGSAASVFNLRHV